MKIAITSTWRVSCRAATKLPLSATAAWGQLRDFHTYAAHDYFHSGFAIDGNIPRAGAALVIEHRCLLFRTLRNGRILRWREGRGYAFSDLSVRGLCRGFPHVLSYRLEPISDQACRLHMQVGGRWTANTPRWMARIWLWWVFSHIVRSVRNRLMWFAIVRKKRL